MSNYSLTRSIRPIKLLAACFAIGLSLPLVSFAKDDNDPEKVCRIYGCENGIPISGGGAGPPSRPEEPGRPKPRPVPVRYCQYFEHINFQGKSGWEQDRVSNGYLGKRWNDEISSLRCSPGCTLTAYEHRDFKGATQEFSGSTPFVGAGWNDRISSIRIRCR